MRSTQHCNRRNNCNNTINQTRRDKKKKSKLYVQERLYYTHEHERLKHNPVTTITVHETQLTVIATTVTAEEARTYKVTAQKTAPDAGGELYRKIQNRVV